jgi:Flp pilus assembly protein TadD
MPDNNDWKMGLLKSQIATGRYTEADKLLQEMIAAAPDNDSLWTLQAGLFMQMDQPAKAAMNYEMLRRMGKADLKTLMLLGDIYMTMDAREVALGAYLEGIAKDGATDVSRSLRAADILVRSGAWTEGGKLIQEIRRLHGGKLVSEEDMKLLKLESRVAMASGEGGKAAGVLEQIIQRNPLDGEALMLLGDHFARSGEKEKAAFRYELAAKIAEFEPDSLVKQAQLLVGDRKFERAVEQLRKAQKLKPRDNVQRYLESVERLARTAGS